MRWPRPLQRCPYLHEISGGDSSSPILMLGPDKRRREGSGVIKSKIKETWSSAATYFTHSAGLHRNGGKARAVFFLSCRLSWPLSWFLAIHFTKFIALARWNSRGSVHSIRTWDQTRTLTHVLTLSIFNRHGCIDYDDLLPTLRVLYEPLFWTM